MPVAQRSIDLNTTAMTASSGPCKLRELEVSNSGAAVVYVRAYNKAAAVFGDTPVWDWMIPAGGTISRSYVEGNLVFETALSFRCTTGAADTDVANPATNQVRINVKVANYG